MSIRRYESRLDGFIINFDVPPGISLSPTDFLTRLAGTFDSEAAFIATPNGSNTLRILYAHDSGNNRIKEARTIPQVSVLSKVVEQNETITINEVSDVDHELRKLGIRSMVSVPLPFRNTTSALVVCNRRTPLKFGVSYVSYDVRTCATIASLYGGARLSDGRTMPILKKPNVSELDVESAEGVEQEPDKAIENTFDVK